MVSFIINSIILGVGLAMDAFSVSLADGLRYPHLRLLDRLKIAAVFGGFQFFMPVLGWVLVNLAGSLFVRIRPFIPWIGFFILVYLGIKMFAEGVGELRGKNTDMSPGSVGGRQLVSQGLATSIDALSVGFVIASYTFLGALFASLIIGVVTFVLCVIGIVIGGRFGVRYSYASALIGGIILIFIGIRLIV